jgi:hypothetical protein
MERKIDAETSPRGRVFSEAEYTADAGAVVAYAAAKGSAVVVAADGRPLVVISIPILDLPPLEE